MKVFNSEKELYKIQHGNKNKIMLFVILLLIVGVIGYSFALYQVRYSKRIIYTKVAPFNIRDVILSVKVEGESTSRTSFPSKTEGLSFSGLECDKANTTIGSWDYDKWSLILNSKGPNKCTVFFKKSKSFSDVIKVDNITIFNDDPDKNLRYAGADPNNYIWFNCDDYDNLTQNTAAQKCEKWRIIGLFNNITKSNGTKENLVKIVRANVIGIIPWDNANTNNWAKSSLQINLNKEYLIEGDDGSWITSKENIESNGYNTTSKSADYKSITSNTLNMIENVTWNIGGYNNSTSPLFVQDIYNAERGTLTYNSQPSTWTGKIALPYASDYGYSIGGNNRNTCLQSNLFWDAPAGCENNSWITISAWSWTLSTLSSTIKSLTTSATSGIGNDHPHYGFRLKTSLYLKSSVKILDGTGSSSTPYILA